MLSLSLRGKDILLGGWGDGGGDGGDDDGGDGGTSKAGTAGTAAALARRSLVPSDTGGDGIGRPTGSVLRLLLRALGCL